MRTEAGVWLLGLCYLVAAVAEVGDSRREKKGGESGLAGGLVGSLWGRLGTPDRARLSECLGEASQTGPPQKSSLFCRLQKEITFILQIAKKKSILFCRLQKRNQFYFADCQKKIYQFYFAKIAQNCILICKHCRKKKSLFYFARIAQNCIVFCKHCPKKSQFYFAQISKTSRFYLAKIAK